ncbi:MAG TPA: zinc ribbon domain-containing protein [Vicinamibacteria bacterium]|nr:zinc ribbon domain-containing protein [Vicinamibacteria bacterium]
MPLYEYRCADCGKAFEKLVARWGQGVSCPACHSTAVEKQLSSFAMTASASPSPAPSGGGGCCGGGCGCRS